MTDFLLIGIILCRVNVAIAHFQSCEAGVDAGTGRGLVDSEAKTWDLHCGIGEGKEIGECEFGDGHIVI